MRLEVLNHIIRQGILIVVHGDFIAGIPLCHGKLIPIQLNGIRSVKLTEKSEGEVAV